MLNEHDGFRGFLIATKTFGEQIVACTRTAVATTDPTGIDDQQYPYLEFVRRASTNLANQRLAQCGFAN
jgi:hypothetical protein